MGKKAFCYFVICLAFLSFLVKTYIYIYNITLLSNMVRAGAAVVR